MIIEPYRRRPAAPLICMVDAEGRILAETGELLEPAQVPAHARVYGFWETIWQLVRDGRGEALCWNNEEIRWRPVAHPDERDRWVPRPYDCFVVKLPAGDRLEQPERVLGELCRWRDWLCAQGAAPTGTTGSCAMSLLRAQLPAKLVTSSGTRPPLLQTLGGRQQLGVRGPGDYRGALQLHDLPAAYASTLGGLRYGGYWLAASNMRLPLEHWAGLGLPVFVRAMVRVPAGLPFGPLPRRPRARQGYQESLLFASQRYPVGCTLTGVWTWQELQAAEAAGCRILQQREAWVHRSSWQPFAAWWQAVIQGRGLGGLAGILAKMTGNALWGRFAMDPRVQGKRGIRSRVGGKLVQRPLRQNPFQYPAHDLAETVAGRVRAELYMAMMEAGGRMVSAHTDGLWCEGELERPDWRLKERAYRLQLLDSQVLRYWPARGRPRVVFAGVPSTVADQAFEDAWKAQTSS